MLILQTSNLLHIKKDFNQSHTDKSSWKIIVIRYFYVITYVMRFYGIALSASLNNGPPPLLLGLLTFGDLGTYYMQTSNT